MKKLSKEVISSLDIQGYTKMKSEYMYLYSGNIVKKRSDMKANKFIGAMPAYTLDEAFELLPKETTIIKKEGKYIIEDITAHNEEGKTLINAIEKMLLWLLDNGLLDKNKSFRE